ncbi:MAG: DUF1499 domain-containing protein [Pseudomonadales bacterium]|jgi:uncharacterized protein (DUF1499 family)|nr:DUF1499 domain-containing protein [Pseudomonadales bacterium]
MPTTVRRSPGRLLLPGLLVLVTGCAGAPPAPEDPAVLEPCPDRPNCVVSRTDAGDAAVDPLPGAGDPLASHRLLLAVLRALPEARITADDGRRVTTVFRSPVLRFRDDVQFLIRDDGTIDVRSASRTGWWDLGANRRRVETLRGLLEAKRASGIPPGVGP